jgi:hypothetical protein
MVEFVRDVIVAVAVLTTLIALAVSHAGEPEPKRHGTVLETAIAANVAPAAAPTAQASDTIPSK